MAHRFAWILAPVLAFVGSPATAQDEVRIQVKWVKGPMWTVDQRLELSSANKGKAVFAGGAGVSQMLVKGNVVTTEKWIDVVTAEADGRPTELQRTFTVSKLTAQKKAAGATALQGLKVVLGVNAEAIEVKSPKDGPEPLVRTMLGKPPLDPVEILLPKGAVAVGAEWEIATEDVMRFQGAICLGVAGTKGRARDDIARLLQVLGGDSPASAARIVKGRLVKVEKDIAEIAFSEDKTLDAVDAGIKGPLFDVPPMTTKIAGTLQFDVAKGRPIHLVWSQVHDMGDFTPRAGTPGAGIVTPGFTETWKLDKTWK